MKGTEKLLVKYLQSAEQLIIPVYQRNYDWKEEHCRKLYDDLLRIIRFGKSSHFFGSIVSISDSMGSTGDYLIIDGQQRITTLSLLFLALVNLMREGKLKPEATDLADRIEKRFLIDEFQPQNKKIKLKPIKGDRRAYELLWKDPSGYEHASNVTLNYNFFYKQLQRNDLSPEDMYTAITKLQIIDISLDPVHDDAQLIFESLNSTGLELNEGDKIRNYILMGLALPQQNEYYEDYWNPIEKKAGYDKQNNSYDVSLFIRDYLSVKQRQIPSMRDIYFKFKEYAEPFKQNGLKELLDDMLAYATRYQKLLSGDKDFPALLNASIYRLNRFESSVTRPFLLEVLRLMDMQHLTQWQVVEVFKIVEAYLFRRNICDLPSNALNKVFLTLANDVQRLGEDGSYLERLKYILTSKKEKARFPDDDEFREGIKLKNIYSMPPRYRAYLFERLENEDSKEYKDIYARIDSGDYTVEHIMPQKLSAKWHEELGNDASVIHEMWLHRLGNLTLTAYNAKYGNCSFLEKRDMPRGFAASGIRLNSDIAKNDRWGLAEMQARSDDLAERALLLWTYPITDYSPPEKQLDEYSLDDNGSFTNKLLVKYRFRNIEQETTSWAEMYANVLKELHNTDRSILNYLADADDTVELALHIRRSASSSGMWRKIDDDIFLWINTSTQYKVNLLLRFFALYHEDPDVLVFFTKDSVADTEEFASRHLARKDYWTAAIPIIREKTGTFLNTNTGTSNWISYGAGYPGISYNCIANSNCAKIELYFGHANAEVNKALFDLIEQKKHEIETAFGEPLDWQRLDGKKGCRISMTLDDVSVKRDEDWPRMIAFHSQTMKEFQDALSVPLQTSIHSFRNAQKM